MCHHLPILSDSALPNFVLPNPTLPNLLGNFTADFLLCLVSLKGVCVCVCVGVCVSVCVCVISHHGGLSSWWSLIRVVSHYVGLSVWSLIMVVSHYGGLSSVVSSGWSLITVVSHQGGL